MPCAPILLTFLFLSSAPKPAPTPFTGKGAYEFTRQVVAFGPRTAGSPASRKLQAFLIRHLKSRGWEIIDDPFTAQTPEGPVRMRNIVARRAGASGRAVVLSGHYDTKRFPFPFAGANDAGSSTGFLLEMARALPSLRLKNDVYLVFFDGEEAFREWSDADSLYGSRHLAARWAAEGLLGRIAALINVDMIGDRDLTIASEYFSSASLRTLAWSIAAELGYSKHFHTTPYPIEDDHVPFLKRGVRALNLIDFDYGPNNSWWHTSADTMDKLSPASFQIVGDVVLEMLRRLEP
jgi:Zn-dependent M28 family amino/carboxypeptidase